jgi:hypothetical protein
MLLAGIYFCKILLHINVDTGLRRYDGLVVIGVKPVSPAWAVSLP